ncbi:MAG TPA: N-acetylmuramoyl-L-alanine amidase [Opitutaceae bacterium]|nr:N-acetylmuramoyl-L-alanine amidase [Opitutaceae bacterium]
MSTPYPEIRRLSPNFDLAPAHERRGVLFHDSIDPFEATIARMLRPESKVSYHVLIARDGTRCTLVDDGHVAWHAGASRFLERTRCNDFLLGAAFAGDTYATPLTSPQIESALEWLEPRWRPCGWTVDRMTDHRQVSPGRKTDLNPVEWERLRRAIAGRFGEIRPA